IGGQVYIGAHGLVPLDDLTGIGGHTSDNGTHGTHRPIFRITYHSLVPNGFEKFNMLYLIGVRIIFSTVGKYFPSAQIFNEGIIPMGLDSTLGTLKSFGHPAHGFRHVATLTG